MKTLIPALILAVAAPAALAQEGPKAAAKPDVRSPRIAVLDLGRVASESLIGKSYAAKIDQIGAEFDSERKKKQVDLEKLDASLKAMQDELEKQQSVLSPEALDKKRQEIVRKSRDRQAFLEDGQAELQRLGERAQQQIQALRNELQIKLKPYFEAVAKEKGIDILIESQVALSVTNDFDVSQDVIIKADDAERAAKAKAPAAAAPAAPKPAAPAPAPTPSPSGR